MENRCKFLAILLIVSYVGYSYCEDESVDADIRCDSVPSGEKKLFPYINNCSLYVECLNGQSTVHSCPDGYWFNAERELCDHPDTSGCIDTVCPPSAVDYFPYSIDCTRYVECYMGVPELHSCPDDLWFNKYTKSCTDPTESNCGQYSTTMEPTWTTPTPTCYGVRPFETVLKPYPGDCAKFIICYGAQESVGECEYPLYFDEKRQMCVNRNESSCDDSTSTTWSTVSPPTTQGGHDDPRCDNGGSGYFPEPDCTQFIWCYNGKAYTYSCPAGLYFDSRSGTCVPPADSDCYETTSSTTISTTTDKDWTPNPFCPYPDPARYLYPYPGDCTKFIVCWNGDKTVEDCPPGLWFNPTIDVCDYPYESGCKENGLEEENDF